MRKFAFLSLLLLASSCCKEEYPLPVVDDKGTLISLPYVWKYSLHKSGSFHSNGFIKFPIIYFNHIVVPTTEINGDNSFRMISASNGREIWKWDDIFSDTPGGDYGVYSLYQYENFLIWQKGTRSYCIDLASGTTQWKHRRTHSFHSRLSGIGNMFFSRGYTDNYPGLNIYLGFKGNLENGSIEQFLIPNFSFNHTISNRCCDVTEMIPYTIGGVLHLVVIYQELTSSEISNFQSYLGLYNLETDEWVYDRKVMNEPNLYGVSLAQPVIYNGRFYANIGHNLVCHDILTGEQVWSRQFSQDFMFSGFIIEEDRVIANCEDMTLYVLRPETGAIIWSLPGAGTSSRMTYYNGVVYFVGGTTTRLHAVDMEQRRTVWLIDASYLEDNSSGFNPTNAVYVIPGKGGGKGRVIALSAYNAYCFETYR